MCDTSNHLWIWMSLIISARLVQSSDSCSNQIQCTSPLDCAAFDKSCTCHTNQRSNRSFTVSVVCIEWSPQQISFTDKMEKRNLKKLAISGVNGTTPFKFMEWFVPKVIPYSFKLHSFDISNFCSDPSNITNHLNITKILAPTRHKDFLNANTGTRIRSLKMSHNCLQSIEGILPPYLFYEFNELDFSFNKFPQIPKFIDGVEKLIKIDLSHNNVSTVSRSDFNKTLEIEQLNLSHNNLSLLPQDLLFDLEFLDVLDLSHNSISSIPKKLVTQNKLLKKFDVSKNKIRQVPNNLFENSTSLVEINMSHNKLKEFSLDLSALKILEVIRLESNNIRYFQFNYLVSHSENMKEISLGDNWIPKVRKLYPHHNARINYDLSNNVIATLEIPLTRYIHHAETFDMSNNCFRSHRMYEDSKYYNDDDERIRNFVCSKCCLETIPHELFHEVTDKVDISFNNIKELDENTLKQFQQIPKVNLSHNKITRVNVTHFENTYKHSAEIVDFDLSYNPLVCDCRLNRFIKYLRNQNKKFTFQTQNNFCSHPPEMNGVSLKTIDYNLLCEYPQKCPNPCQCYVEDIEKISFVSIACSNSNLTRFPNINSSVAIHLNLTKNKISSLPQKDDPIWSQLTILDLSYNHLKSLKNMTISPNLSILYLNNNSLSEFDATIASLSHLSEIRLANNPWKCDCEMSKFVVKSRLFDEKYEWVCAIDNRMYNFTDIDEICKTFNLLWLLLPVITLVILLSVFIILSNKYKSEILYYMFSKGICLKFVSEEDVDADKAYDAFVSYSSEDEDWVVDFLVPGLETGVPSYKLCLHNRDWLAGEFITDQIVRSVESSRRTILVLTDNFLNSQWSRFEFDIAYQQGLKDKVHRVIAVVPNEVPDLSKIDQEFKTFITLTTYVEAKKPYFWTKLRASMPRTKNTRVPATKRETIYLNSTFTENSDLAHNSDETEGFLNDTTKINAC